MNDRFKFRVWNEKERKFILDHNYPIGSDYFLALDTEGKLLKIGMGDLNEEKQCSWGNVEEYQGIVEQCTGLKDKNGRLIYEGDIVRLTRRKDNILQKRGSCFTVRYLTHRFCGFGYGVNNRSVDMCLTESKAKCLEVIGNIHENADLLEESRETNN